MRYSRRYAPRVISVNRRSNTTVKPVQLGGPRRHGAADKLVRALDSVFESVLAAIGALVFWLRSLRGWASAAAWSAIVLGAFSLGVLTVTALQIHTVTLIDGDLKVQIRSTDDTVGELLERYQVSLYPEDEVYPPAAARMSNGMRIEITRSVPINVFDGDLSYTVRMINGTVGDALVRGGIEVGPEDVVFPVSDAILTPGMSVRVTRVWHDRYLESRRIPYAIEYRTDNTLLKGTEKTVQDGQYGEALREIQIVYNNGLEVARNVLSESVASRPRDAVVLVGTKVEVKPPSQPSINTNNNTNSAANPPATRPAQPSRSEEPTNKGGQVVYQGKTYAYTKVLSGKAYAYTGGGLTYSETPARRGVVAVDKSVIPLGTRLYIPGYGLAVAEDTGDKNIKGASIDLYMDTEEECFRWGIRPISIYILK